MGTVPIVVVLRWASDAHGCRLDGSRCYLVCDVKYSLRAAESACGQRFDFIEVVPMNLFLEILRFVAYATGIARNLYALWKDYRQNG